LQIPLIVGKSGEALLTIADIATQAKEQAFFIAKSKRAQARAAEKGDVKHCRTDEGSGEESEEMAALSSVDNNSTMEVDDKVHGSTKTKVAVKAKRPAE